jgi:hypothetical protein
MEVVSAGDGGKLVVHFQFIFKGLRTKIIDVQGQKVGIPAQLRKTGNSPSFCLFVLSHPSKIC